MNFATREDIEAPIDEVFAALSDFEGFERAALRRGAAVTRTDVPPVAGVGMGWRVVFDYRGKRRTLTGRLAAMEVPSMMRFTGDATAVSGVLMLELVALSRRATRVSVSLDIEPKTLVARIFVQSLRLTKGRVNDRFAKRVKAFAMGIEDRLRSATLN